MLLAHDDLSLAFRDENLSIHLAKQHIMVARSATGIYPFQKLVADAKRSHAMAKKKRKENRRKQPSPADMPSLPDPRVMEHFMKQLPLGPQSEADQDTPLAKAHEILLHAYQKT
jgi:hypothetical protein